MALVRCPLVVLARQPAGMVAGMTICMVGAGMLVRGTMVHRHIHIRHVMAGRRGRAHFRCGAGITRRAQHRGRHGSPQRQQHGQEQQEQYSDGLHG